MSYQVLYRTYRPARFEEVVGQDYIVKTLKNAIKLNKIAHAYLFAGPRGTGKTTVAKLFAKAVNCPVFGEESCDKCDSCVAYNEGNHPDIIEMDAASNTGVDDIRSIIEEVPYAPILGRFKVYIIDEVHMLSSSAFNALLKTLEEPPAHVIFILATTDPQKVLPTVLSRCQRYNFSKISVIDMKNKMKEILKKEEIEYHEKALEEIASLAEGGMRDALSILEQVLSYNAEGVFLEDVEKIFGLSTSQEKVKLLISTHNNNINEVIGTLRNMYASGIDMKRLSIDLLEIIKETILYSDEGNSDLLNKISALDGQDILNATNVTTLLNDIKYLEDCLLNTKTNQNFLTYLELCLIQMANGNASSSTEVKEVIKEVIVEKPVVKEVIKEVIKEVEKPVVEEVKEEIVEEVQEEEIQEEIEQTQEEVEEKQESEPEIKEAILEKQEDPIEEIKTEGSGVDLDFIARVLAHATKQDKINDTIIYNRLELYKYEADNRKYYELLIGSELFASGPDAIVISAEQTQASNINSRVLNEDLFNFISNEFGINKMVYAVSKEEMKPLIQKYKSLTIEDKLMNLDIKKYEKKKPRTTEDKLKELFDNVNVE